MYMRIFSKRLKELRTERGISQITIAEAIGVSQSMLTRWESDECEPTASNIIALSNFFEVPTDYLLGKTDYY